MEEVVGLPLPDLRRIDVSERDGVLNQVLQAAEDLAAALQLAIQHVQWRALAAACSYGRVAEPAPRLRLGHHGR